MRTRDELSNARLPKVQMVKAPYGQVTSDGNDDFAQGDLIPNTTSGETYEEQIHELLCDIRDLLTKE